MNSFGSVQVTARVGRWDDLRIWRLTLASPATIKKFRDPVVVAMELAKRGAGVWVSDRSFELARAVSDEIVAEGNQAQPLELDVTKRENVVSGADHVFRKDGRLDLLVANAGVSTMNHFLELSEEEWDFNFAVNSKGTFLTIQGFARQMVKQELISGREIRGKIVATASMAARAAAPLLVHYSASKFAVLGLVQSVAKELAPQKIEYAGAGSRQGSKTSRTVTG